MSVSGPGPDQRQTPPQPPHRASGWRSALAELGLYVALLLAPIAVGLALIVAIAVGMWRLLRSNRIGVVLTIFVAITVAMAFGGFLLVAALAPRG